MPPKSRHWVFTINNPQNELQLDQERVSYAIYQYEQAPSTGTLHIQGYLYLKCPTTFNGVRGLLPAGSHVEVSRDPESAIRYCSKEDTRIAGPIEHGKRPILRGQGILEAARTLSRVEFLDHCINARIPKGYYDEALRLICNSSSTIYETDASLVERIQQPLRSWMLPEEGIKSIIVQGKSGSGKTSWAKWVAPKPALFVTHIDDLRKLTAEHKSIIFDDMDFKHTPRTAQIHLVDRGDVRSIHIRYGTATIPAGMIKIFTCNEFPFMEDDAIKRRTLLINYS